LVTNGSSDAGFVAVGDQTASFGAAGRASGPLS
jgi:hypothetical protein